MPTIREVRLPTGLTMTLGCGWPVPDGWRARGMGPGAQIGREGDGARVRAHAAVAAAAEDIGEGMDADHERAVLRGAGADRGGG